MGLLPQEEKRRVLYVLADGLLREQCHVIQYSTFESLPAIGEPFKIYEVKKEDEESTMYHWGVVMEEDENGNSQEVEKYIEGTGTAKLRIIKNDDGTEKMRKWEYIYPGITGYITGVTTRDGDYGTSLLISIKDENEEEFTLALQAKSKYGEDFLHKLPNVDFTKEITIKPFNFTDGERKVTGVTLSQLSPDGELHKLTNAFNWKDTDGNWQSVDGYPQVDEKKKPKNSDQWMVFFTNRREWVIGNLTERGLITEAAAKAEEPEF